MRKDIYKEVPETFHKQFYRTLAELDDTPQPKKYRRRYGLLLAAAILVFASVTVAAAGLMGWHRQMSSRFGTDRELENKLSTEQVAIPQTSAVGENGLDFQALQALWTDSFCYFLLRMTMPEEIEWNDDILFEDVRIHLKNLIQTQKSEVTGLLVEGEWEIPLILPPAQADTIRFYPEQSSPCPGIWMNPVTSVLSFPWRLPWIRTKLPVFSSMTAGREESSL